MQANNTTKFHSNQTYMTDLHLINNHKKTEIFFVLFYYLIILLLFVAKKSNQTLRRISRLKRASRISQIGRIIIYKYLKYVRISLDWRQSVCTCKRTRMLRDIYITHNSKRNKEKEREKHSIRIEIKQNNKSEPKKVEYKIKKLKKRESSRQEQ